MIYTRFFKEIYNDGIRIITGIKASMKNYLMTMKDKILLRKRSIIESVFNILKNHMTLEHTRHRSPINFLVNIISCLVAYQFRANKPKIKMMVDVKDFLLRGWWKFFRELFRVGVYNNKRIHLALKMPPKLFYQRFAEKNI